MCVWSWLVCRRWRWCRWARWRNERTHYSGNFIPGGSLGELVFNFLLSADILSPPMTHSAKAQKRREWDKEWGALSKEGNIWWKGSPHAEWVDVMGVSWLGWICEWSFHLIFVSFFPPDLSLLVFMILWVHDIFLLKCPGPELQKLQILGSIFISIWSIVRPNITERSYFCLFLSCELLGVVELNSRGRVFILPRPSRYLFGHVSRSLHFLIFSFTLFFCFDFRVAIVFQLPIKEGFNLISICVFQSLERALRSRVNSFLSSYLLKRGLNDRQCLSWPLFAPSFAFFFIWFWFWLRPEWWMTYPGNPFGMSLCVRYFLSWPFLRQLFPPFTVVMPIDSSPLTSVSLFFLPHFSSSWPRPGWWPDIPC